MTDHDYDQTEFDREDYERTLVEEEWDREGADPYQGCPQ